MIKSENFLFHLIIIGGAMYSSGGSNEPPELAIFKKNYIIYNIYFLYDPPK